MAKYTVERMTYEYERRYVEQVQVGVYNSLDMERTSLQALGVDVEAVEMRLDFGNFVDAGMDPQEAYWLVTPEDGMGVAA